MLRPQPRPNPRPIGSSANSAEYRLSQQVGTVGSGIGQRQTSSLLPGVPPLSVIEAQYQPSFQSLQNQYGIAGQRYNLDLRSLQNQLKSLGPNTDLQKQKIDLDIAWARNQMGRTNQSTDLNNMLLQQNLRRGLESGQDWINTQGQLVNSQLGDLNIQAAGAARDIEYGNQRLIMAFQALGFDKEDYVNLQNILNSRQQNLNTMTNLQSERVQREHAAEKRRVYDDAVARGALTSGGAAADLSDVDKSLKTAQEMLQEEHRYGSDQVTYQRKSADTDWGRSQLRYKETEAGIRNEQDQLKDRIKLLESEGERLRTSYAFGAREKGREMQGLKDRTQHDIMQNEISRNASLDALSRDIAQWGIDKQLLDQQMKDAAARIGIERELAELDFRARMGQLDMQGAQLLMQMQQGLLAYTDIAQRNPWLLNVVGNRNRFTPGSGTSSRRSGGGGGRPMAMR